MGSYGHVRVGRREAGAAAQVAAYAFGLGPGELRAAGLSEDHAQHGRSGTTTVPREESDELVVTDQPLAFGVCDDAFELAVAEHRCNIDDDPTGCGYPDPLDSRHLVIGQRPDAVERDTLSLTVPSRGHHVSRASVKLGPQLPEPGRIGMAESRSRGRVGATAAISPGFAMRASPSWPTSDATQLPAAPKHRASGIRLTVEAPSPPNDLPPTFSLTA